MHKQIEQFKEKYFRHSLSDTTISKLVLSKQIPLHCKSLLILKFHNIQLVAIYYSHDSISIPLDVRAQQLA
jgi:hypothetical protein